MRRPCFEQSQVFTQGSAENVSLHSNSKMLLLTLPKHHWFCHFVYTFRSLALLIKTAKATKNVYQAAEMILLLVVKSVIFRI